MHLEFAEGSMQKADLTIDDVGRPHKIRVWHDNAGLAAGWHLDKVVMTNKVSATLDINKHSARTLNIGLKTAIFLE